MYLFYSKQKKKKKGKQTIWKLEFDKPGKKEKNLSNFKEIIT